jgi:hypothetical protein
VKLSVSSGAIASIFGVAGWGVHFFLLVSEKYPRLGIKLGSSLQSKVAIVSIIFLCLAGLLGLVSVARKDGRPAGIAGIILATAFVVYIYACVYYFGRV